MPIQNISNGWKKVKLGEVVEITSSKRIYLRDYVDKGVLFYRGKEIIKLHNGDEVTEPLYISEKKYLELKEKYGVPNEGDLLLTSVGTIGIPYIVKKNDKFYFKDGNLLWFKNFDKKVVYNKYLYYIFSSFYGKELLNSILIGSSQKALTIVALKSLELLLPSLPVQRKIASILSAYDNLIENNNKRIKSLEAMAKAIFDDMMKQAEEKGELEEKFILEENEYFEFIRENVKKFEGEKIYYATADIDGINIVGKGEKVNYKNKPSRAQKQPVKNSVWFARMIDTYKVLVFSNVNEHITNNILLSSGMVGFKSKDNLYLPFLFWTINNKKFHKLKDSYCTGATQRALTNDGLKMIKIKFPPKEDIIEFGKFAKPILDLILNLQLQNQNLKQTRDLLIPRLVSGKLDVEKMEVI